MCLMLTFSSGTSDTPIAVPNLSGLMSALDLSESA